MTERSKKGSEHFNFNQTYVTYSLLVVLLLVAAGTWSLVNYQDHLSMAKFDLD